MDILDMNNPHRRIASQQTSEEIASVDEHRPIETNQSIGYNGNHVQRSHTVETGQERTQNSEFYVDDTITSLNQTQEVNCIESPIQEGKSARQKSEHYREKIAQATLFQQPAKQSEQLESDQSFKIQRLQSPTELKNVQEGVHYQTTARPARKSLRKKSTKTAKRNGNAKQDMAYYGVADESVPQDQNYTTVLVDMSNQNLSNKFNGRSSIVSLDKGSIVGTQRTSIGGLQEQIKGIGRDLKENGPQKTLPIRIGQGLNEPSKPFRSPLQTIPNSQTASRPNERAELLSTKQPQKMAQAGSDNIAEHQVLSARTLTLSTHIGSKMPMSSLSSASVAQNNNNLKFQKISTNQLQTQQDDTLPKASLDLSSMNKSGASRPRKYNNNRVDQVFMSGMNEVQLLRQQMDALNKLEQLKQEKKFKKKKSSRLLPSVHTKMHDGVLLPLDRNQHQQPNQFSNDNIDPSSFAIELNNVPLGGSLVRSEDSRVCYQDDCLSPFVKRQEALRKANRIQESIQHLKSIKKSTDRLVEINQKQITQDDDRIQLRPSQLLKQDMNRKDKKVTIARGIGGNLTRPNAATHDVLPGMRKQPSDISRAFGNLMTKQQSMRHMNLQNQKKLLQRANSGTQSSKLTAFNINQKSVEMYDQPTTECETAMKSQSSRALAELGQRQLSNKNVLGVVSEHAQTKTMRTKYRKGVKSLTKLTPIDYKTANDRQESTYNSQSLLPAIRNDSAGKHETTTLAQTSKISPLVLSRKVVGTNSITRNGSPLMDVAGQNHPLVSPMLAQIKSGQLSKAVRESHQQKEAQRKTLKGSMVNMDQATPLVNNSELRSSFHTQGSVDGVARIQISQKGSELPKGYLQMTESAMIRKQESNLKSQKSGTQNAQKVSAPQKEVKSTLMAVHKTLLTDSTHDYTQSNIDQKFLQSTARRDKQMNKRALREQQQKFSNSVDDIEATDLRTDDTKIPPETGQVLARLANDPNFVANNETARWHQGSMDGESATRPPIDIRAMSRTQQQYHNTCPSVLEKDCLQEAQKIERTQTPTSPVDQQKFHELGDHLSSVQQIEKASQTLSQPSLALDKNNFSQQLVQLIASSSGRNLPNGSQEDQSSIHADGLYFNQNSIDQRSQTIQSQQTLVGTTLGAQDHESKAGGPASRNIKRLPYKQSSKGGTKYEERIKQMREVYCKQNALYPPQSLQGGTPSSPARNKLKQGSQGSPPRKTNSPMKSGKAPPFKNPRRAEPIELKKMNPKQQDLIQHIRQATRDKLEELAEMHTDDINKLGAINLNKINSSTSILEALIAKALQEQLAQHAIEEVLGSPERQDALLNESREQLSSSTLDPHNVMRVIHSVTKKREDAHLLLKEHERRQRIKKIYGDQMLKSPPSLNKTRQGQSSRKLISSSTKTTMERLAEEALRMADVEEQAKSNESAVHQAQPDGLAAAAHGEGSMAEEALVKHFTERPSLQSSEQEEVMKKPPVVERVVKTDIPASKEKIIKIKSSKVLFKNPSMNRVPSRQASNSGLVSRKQSSVKSPTVVASSCENTPKIVAQQEPVSKELSEIKMRQVQQIDEEEPETLIIKKEEEKAASEIKAIVEASVASANKTRQPESQLVSPANRDQSSHHMTFYNTNVYIQRSGEKPEQVSQRSSTTKMELPIPLNFKAEPTAFTSCQEEETIKKTLESELPSQIELNQIQDHLATQLPSEVAQQIMQPILQPTLHIRTPTDITKSSAAAPTEEAHCDDDFIEDDSPRGFVKVFEVEAYHDGMESTPGSSRSRMTPSPLNYAQGGSRLGGGGASIKNSSNSCSKSPSGATLNKQPSFRRKRVIGVKSSQGGAQQKPKLN